MARRELGPAALLVSRAVASTLPGDAVVGCSGGADSLALAIGAQWAAHRSGANLTVVVVDHGLQEGSAEVAARTVALLEERGIAAEAVRVRVADTGSGLEAAAREARLAALTERGQPVLLGHTMDDQAESVLLGLLRGSGTRSLAGMSPGPSLHHAQAEAPLLRPLLALRRADTVQACREWGVSPWHDPMNDDPAFARVAIRRHLAALGQAVGRDLTPALARTAQLARADADLLDELAAEALPVDGDLAVEDLRLLPEALRWRVLHRWLRGAVGAVEFQHVLAVDALVTNWRGQGPLALPGARVHRSEGLLRLVR